MAYEVLLGKRTVGTIGIDNKIQYNEENVSQAIKEIIAGQSVGSYFTTAKVIYRWDRNRKTNNDAVYAMWKSNPIMQNRISQLNALVFGRSLKWIYDEPTQTIIDRFWRTNRLRSRLNAIGTDCQLYGEVFIALYPQPSGDVKIGIYEANQVEMDINPGNVYEVNKYMISYKNEETNKDEIFEMTPLEQYLNEIEYATPITAGVTKRSRKNMGMNGASKLKTKKGVILHIKFNNSTDEIYGTSDFKQVFDILPDYMNFVGDRLTIHQLYGSPAYDITIDTDDNQTIEKRIGELAGFTIGSNPVHNTKEVWKPLQFSGNSISATEDEGILRGLLCSGMGFPEHLLFNQANNQFDDNTFAVVKLAEDRQDAFRSALIDIHKFVVAIAGGDPLTVDDGQLIFPEINIMSEKTKAETYVLKVGSNICSRKTASINMGHNWEFEQKQMLEEHELLGDLIGNNSDVAGAIGGRFTNRVNNQDPSRDDGKDDKAARQNVENISTQVFGDGKTNN